MLYAHVTSSCKRRVGLLRVMASFSEYKRQRFVSLWQDGYKAPSIAKILARENLPATRQGVHKFLNKYKECGTFGRREGAGRRSKISTSTLQCMFTQSSSANGLFKLMSLYEVGPKGKKFSQSWPEVRTKLA